MADGAPGPSVAKMHLVGQALGLPPSFQNIESLGFRDQLFLIFFSFFLVSELTTTKK